MQFKQKNDNTFTYEIIRLINDHSSAGNYMDTYAAGDYKVT